MDVDRQIPPAPRGWWARLRGLSRSLKRELAVYRAVLGHPGTPRLAKLCLALAVGYVLLPFDLVPDFIPVLGQLDDVLIVPALVGLGLWLVPGAVLAECRARVAGGVGSGCKGPERSSDKDLTPNCLASDQRSG